MKFDPKIYRIGKWYEWEVTRLDDIAYYLFLINYDRNQKSSLPMLEFATQQYMIKEFNETEFHFSHYYREAQILIRKEKIKKITQNGTT